MADRTILNLALRAGALLFYHKRHCDRCERHFEKAYMFLIMASQQLFMAEECLDVDTTKDDKK